MLHSLTALPPAAPIQLQQFAEHYKSAPVEFNLGRILDAVETLLKIAEKAATSPYMAGCFYRKICLINQAAMNLQVDDLLAQARVLFPDLFGQLSGFKCIDPALHNALTRALINSLLAEAFLKDRLANRGAECIKRLLRADISQLVDCAFQDEFCDLFEQKCGAVDVTMSYKTCVSCMALFQLQSAPIDEGGSRADFASRQDAIFEFFRAKEQHTLYFLNEPLYCGGKLVVLARFVQFPSDLEGKSAVSGGFKQPDASFSGNLPEHSDPTTFQPAGCFSAVQRQQNTDVTLKPHKSQTQTLTALRSMVEADKLRARGPKTGLPTSNTAYAPLVEVKTDYLTVSSLKAVNPVLSELEDCQSQGPQYLWR